MIRRLAFTVSPIFQFITLALLVFNQTAFADCDYLEPSPQPEWITQPKAPEGFYTGIGSINIEDGDFAGSIAMAKQRAITDLAASIKVRVKNQLTITEAMNTTGQGTRDMESLSTLTVDNTLEFVEVDEIWLDRDDCILWTRVKVSKQSVDKQKDKTYAQQLYSEFEGLLASLDNANLTFSERQTQVQKAADLIEQIDFDALPRVQVETARSQLESAQQSLNNLTQSFEKSQPLLADLRQARLEYENAKTSDARAKASQKAKQLGLRIQQLSPINNQLGLAEQALFELAKIDLQADNTCSAQARLQTIANNSRNDSYQTQAQDQLSSLECSEAGRRQAAIRNTVEARDVRLWCGTETDGTLRYWAKACDKMREWVNQYGGVVVSSEKIKPEQLQTIDSANSNKTGIDLIIYANGNVESRDNPSNPNGRDYRFSGEVTQSAKAPETVLMVDRFNGMTGWNPVGETFALDLLAVNLVKRFESKLGSALTP